MNNLIKIIFDIVIWAFVPNILIIVIYFTRVVIAKTDDKRQKSAMKSGFWAGFLLFIMFLIYQVGFFVTHGFPDNPIYQGFNIILAIGSGIVGFCLFALGKQMASARLSGFAILILTFLSFYTLLNYLFIRTHNELILSLTLGVSFGVLAFFASSPASIARTLKEGRIA